MNDTTSPEPPAKILIVDDMPANLRLLAGMLANQGYIVQEATNGVGALECIEQDPPDLVLLDVRMPGMDGYEICRRIKSQEATRTIPVIFVSALDEQTDKIQGFAAGGVDYITKPFHLREVLARVDTHLMVRRLQYRLEQQNAQLHQEILERIRAETALQAANEVLEQRVIERTKELAQVNDSLNAELRERLLAEKEREALLSIVRKGAQQVREIMHTVPEGLLLLEGDGRIAQANPAAQKCLQILAEDIASGEILTSLGEIPLAELLNSPIGLFHEIRKNGSVFEVIARPVEGDAEEQRWVMLVRDVSREREIQQQLQQQDRLAAVGQMAAGIAHDFNNILAVILLYTEMALNTPAISERLLDRLQIIAQQSHRASELIEQILDFSRRSVLERRPMDLLPFLKEQLKLLQRTLPEDIELELEAEDERYTVEADPTRMQQMIMNLAVNARDAMPGGGKLSMRILRYGGEKIIPCVACGSVGGSSWICIEVRDTGIGIEAAALPYIFEPFYTTKELGKGTGLGLSQVFGIVKSHDGHLHVESRPGNGAAFFLYLPAHQAEGAQRADTDLAALIQGRGETILLVEDEPTTRNALAEGLMLINYRVVALNNGKEALNYVREQPEAIHLVLSDVVMPEMGGMALVQTLRQEGFRRPIVLMTGHPIPYSDELTLELNAVVWLQKPPRLTQLSHVISQALDGDR